MRWIQAALLTSALMGYRALAELTFTVEATRNGKPIPDSEIKLEPFEFGRSRNGRGAAAPHSTHRKVRRTNPTVNSANWCGSVNYTPSSNQIKLVHGYFQHPACSIRAGMTTYPQAAAAWVGIDGDPWTSALLQSGTVCKIDNSTGITKNEAWWQWFPDAAFTISSMPVAADDWFEVIIDATSTTAGTITITNLTQGISYTITISNGPTLARTSADWIVERPYYGDTLAGFPSFTDVWFEEAYANLTSGASLGILGANQYQIPSYCASAEWDDSQQVSWSLS
ncbi:hypothetical protein VTK56DRAFT_3856 [Thermocarpiscus australiensis]